MSTLRCGGIVLCGGESKRMGSPKAWLPFGAETLLQRVVRLIRSVADPVVVVAAPGQALPELPAEVLVVRDEERGRGPLQGLAAGLDAVRVAADAAFVSSCDVPFLQPAFVQRMVSLLGDHQICVPFVEGYHHTLAAVYHVNVLPVIRQLLDANRMRPFFLFEAVSTRVVQSDELRDTDPDLQTLRNLNTPDEYESALRELVRCHSLFFG